MQQVDQLYQFILLKIQHTIQISISYPLMTHFPSTPNILTYPWLKTLFIFHISSLNKLSSWIFSNIFFLPICCPHSGALSSFLWRRYLACVLGGERSIYSSVESKVFISSAPLLLVTIFYSLFNSSALLSILLLHIKRSILNIFMWSTLLNLLYTSPFHNLTVSTLYSMSSLHYSNPLCKSYHLILSPLLLVNSGSLPLSVLLLPMTLTLSRGEYPDTWLADFDS